MRPSRGFVWAPACAALTRIRRPAHTVASPFELSMARPAILDSALRRLTAAIDQLEAAGERLAQADAEKRDLADTLAVMQADRSRLAQELDTALARTRMLQHATDDVASRLGEAAGTIRHLLASAGEDPA